MSRDKTGNGRVVGRVDVPHRCSPPEYRIQLGDVDDRAALSEGTVWECPCGRRWVLLRRSRNASDYLIGWRRYHGGALGSLRVRWTALPDLAQAVVGTVAALAAVALVAVLTALLIAAIGALL